MRSINRECRLPQSRGALLPDPPPPKRSLGEGLGGDRDEAPRRDDPALLTNSTRNVTFRSEVTSGCPGVAPIRAEFCASRPEVTFYRHGSRQVRTLNHEHGDADSMIELKLRIDATGTPAALIAELAALLRRYPGHQPVILDVVTPVRCLLPRRADPRRRLQPQPQLEARQPARRRTAMVPT